MSHLHASTPPWAKKRKREESPCSSSDASEPVEPQWKRWTTSKHAQAPWVKRNDPLSPSSLATLSKAGRNDELDQAVIDMFNWTRSDLADELFGQYMERIVGLCQDEPPGAKSWRRVVARYQALGAGREEIADLEQAREPLWTRTRLRHTSNTLATPTAVADAIRTLVTESENINGPVLDVKVKRQLMSILDQMHSSAPRLSSTGNQVQPQKVDIQPEAAKADMAIQLSSAFQAPVAQMVTPKVRVDSTSCPSKVHTDSSKLPASPHIARGYKSPISPESQCDSTTQHPPPLDNANKAPHRFPFDGADKSSSLPESPTSSKTSSLMKSSSLSRQSSFSQQPAASTSQAIESRRPSVFAEAAKSLSRFDLECSSKPLSPSESPNTTKPPVHFTIANNQADVQPTQRPRLEVDSKTLHKSAENVLATPSSATPDRRTSSSSQLSAKPPLAPTGPRRLPLFQAKIMPLQSSLSESEQREEILRACDKANVPAQHATPCPSDKQAWLLQFANVDDMRASLGTDLVLDKATVQILSRAQKPTYQVFRAFSSYFPSVNAAGTEIIAAVARHYPSHKFSLQGQTDTSTKRRKWVLVFETPVEQDTFNVFATIARGKEALEFCALAPRAARCFVCNRFGHEVTRCSFISRVAPEHRHPQYLERVPWLV